MQARRSPVVPHLFRQSRRMHKSISPRQPAHSAKMSGIDRSVTQHDTATRQTVSIREITAHFRLYLTLWLANKLTVWID